MIQYTQGELPLNITQTNSELLPSWMKALGDRRLTTHSKTVKPIQLQLPLCLS